MTSKNKRLPAMIAAASLLLLVPLIAMQFTSEVEWTASDFIIAGGLLYGTVALCELVLRKVRKSSHRIGLCAAVLLLLLIVWAELAVGVFGTPFAGS